MAEVVCEWGLAGIEAWLPRASVSSLQRLVPGARVLLPSPNGSRLSLETRGTPTICGSLRNVTAAAEEANDIAKDGVIAVIAAGERWPDQTLRPAIEDWLGAGAIIRVLGGIESPEATLARFTFSAAEPSIDAIIRGSISGRELIDRGFEADVDIALEIDSSASVPILNEGEYRSR